VSASPAHRAPTPDKAHAPSDRPARRRRAEQRRRERHFRRRRRDLLEDTTVALLAAIVLLTVTAGLGVLALLEVPLAAILIGSMIVERRLRRRGAPLRARPRHADRRSRTR
jgi:hypothetical protein